MLKKILVTGGSGFIGSHVVDNLVKKKFQVSIYETKPKPKPYPHNINTNIKNFKKLLLKLSVN